MPLTKQTNTGLNYLNREKTPADGVGFFSNLQHYEKQLGSNGVGGIVFSLTKPYVVGSHTLMVFVNGTKAELVTSASTSMEYEETDLATVTFGAALNPADIVEFLVIGTYEILDTTQLFMPPGFVFPVINSNTPPTGTLECNGALISKTTYANLYSGYPLSIGNRYGEVGGSFYLPDYRGRVLRHWDAGSGRDPDAASRYADNGGWTGNNVGSMQDDEFESHLHDIQNSKWQNGTGESSHRQGDTTGAITSAFQTQLSGGNETRMKNAAVMWCIKY